ncbi:MAG: NADH-quinone oxidoreductase subunit L [Gammaproteobacteria bacterium]|nr:NADH-quinone oxidoreductase subunit L [Gammaproteobacteria bacterium]
MWLQWIPLKGNFINLTLLIILAPLVAGLIAGVFGKRIGRSGAHSITILGVLLSFIASMLICYLLYEQNFAPVNANIYTWGISGSFSFSVGFMIDRLSAAMMGIVSFVSLVVHIYSIGYMKDDDGYQRFFSYISLFTFAMLMLVSANNFLQLFFGWEGVGLVSYLLIGFWFKKESANFGSLKAFIVNRVGDFGFLLGIAAVLNYTGSLDYQTLFNFAPTLPSSIVTLICLLLFVGAMGKSAQMPLHIWLPESMEGPTPISALIHAATMVTAGIYMVARMSPVFEYSSTALSVVLIIGATGALFTGFVALVQNDIKRVVAYSTLSQLGYMVAALGASAYSVAIFHLITHAFFKALLFLAAGSVIIALHHEQDMRRMGGLKKYMPITYICFLVGALALSAIPPFAGFFSKDLVIEAVNDTHLWGSTYAYYCVLLGAFITPLYIFRSFFMTFHGEERFSDEVKHHLHESSWVILLPLILLAIPSVLSGYYLIKPLIFNHDFASSIFVLPSHVIDFHMPVLNSLPLGLSFAGIILAWIFYNRFPLLPAKLSKHFSVIYKILVYKYGFDWFNEHIIMPSVRTLANIFFKVGDEKIVDDTFVNGSGRMMTKLSQAARKLQSGYLYHYVFLMLLGLIILLYWIMLCPY